MSSTAPTSPSAQPAGRWFRRHGGWIALGLGVALVVLGWWFASTPVYLIGLVLAAAGLARVTRGPRPLRAVLGLAVLGGGVAGPWYAISQAYEPVGVAVDDAFELSSAGTFPLGDGTVLVQDERLVAVAQDGSVTTSDRLERLVAVWPFGEDVVVAHTATGLVGLDATGSRLWELAFDGRDELLVTEGQEDPSLVVAVDDEVTVLRTCAREDGTRLCTWTGVDARAGEVLWSHEGPWAQGWPTQATGVRTLVRPHVASRFTTGASDGTVEVREAATGEVLHRVADPEDATVVLAGDSTLVLREGAECTAELLGDGAPAWTSVFPCESWDPPLAPTAGYGSAVGDGYWAYAGGERPLVLDLRDGAVRAEGPRIDEATYPHGSPAHPWTHVLGAGVDVHLGEEGIVVRDPGDGRPLWEMAVPAEDLTTVQATGELVVIGREVRPLLLHEWFGPRDATPELVEVRDAATGEVVATVRDGGNFEGHVLAGDRALILALDHSGDVTVRIVSAGQDAEARAGS